MKKRIELLIVVFMTIIKLSYGQNTDSTKSTNQFSGTISVTNNGLSFIPTFSLGKPAALFNLSMTKGKFSFEPELRFSITGKPWSFVFWERYKLVKTNKFRITLGVNGSLNFKSTPFNLNGVVSEYAVERRYIAAELSPNYLITKNISIGTYYLYSRGLDVGAIGNTHFITVNANISNIKLVEKFLLRVTPQFYFLKLDHQHGYYFSSSIQLVRKKLPFSISSVINQAVQTTITGSKDFVWNISLNYNFNHKYAKLVQAQ